MLQRCGCACNDAGEFHSRYYHPSNGRFWFYGDDNPAKRLELLDAYLGEFEARPVQSAVETQSLLSEPRRVTAHYAAGDGEDGEEQKAYVALNWVLTDTHLDVETELALGFLDYLLLGTSAAPLRKALNDSGLGAALIGGGIDDELKQPIFSVGLKGVDPAATDKVEVLVLEKLGELAKTGFTASAVEAAINTIEFSLRENNTGSFPRGLSLMLRAVGAWIYDRDPYVPIQWEEALESFKTKLAKGEDVFGPLISRYLLDNRHRVSVVMLPDPALGARTEAAEKERLEAARAALARDELVRVAADTAALKERQETPDAPEALTCIPSLKLSDIPRTVTKVPTSVSELNPQGSLLLGHELFTNDVLYLEAALDMRPVPADLLPLMGTRKESFVELTERIGRKTGGVSVYPFTSAKRGQAEPVAYVMVRGKAMGGKAGELVDIMRDVLTDARLDDKARFTQMVLETKAGLEAGLVGSGHRFAGARLGAQRSQAGWVSEAMGGLSYLEYIRGLAKRVESDWEGVQADLESIRSLLLQRRGAIINATGDARALAAAERHGKGLLAALPAASAGAADWSGRQLARTNEALVVPTQVNYVGKAANLYADAGYKLSGAAYVVEKYLGTSWLWDKVRVVGGAYGGFCSFDSHSGQFTYLSYRDPNLLDTLEAYDGSPAFLKGLELDTDALTKAVIGTMGDIDAYQLPDAKGYAQFSRHLLGVTDEERQMRREQILSTTQKDFREFGEVIEAASGPAARVVAVTSADKAAAVNEERPGFWEVKKVL
ncbi:presequence protease [Raphidocelis subcapitata]|uniref:Presequence protease n=1 Tax=Raphidocelis subcapitata TaxID=307507 RepID=A0A2V0NQJ0_9CHLO|nr:presequence protease [Raphidocelis subcapitata]|eukprot:GBF88872.1 presequence protease [Raphidocelis subcapitata]